MYFPFPKPYEDGVFPPVVFPPFGAIVIESIFINLRFQWDFYSNTLIYNNNEFCNLIGQLIYTIQIIILANKNLDFIKAGLKTLY